MWLENRGGGIRAARDRAQARGDDVTMHFDPREFMDGAVTGRPEPLGRPAILAIVSSNTLAATMLQQSQWHSGGAGD